MSTRCNVVIKDNYDRLFFYRHSDGYPEETVPSLNVFMEWLKARRIRDNVEQAAGWLIVMGNREYKKESEPRESGFGGWKVGAYEPAICLHGDIEYLYEIDLEAKTLQYGEADVISRTKATVKWGNGESEIVDYSR